MPLLKKKSLDTASSPEHFRDDEEVFYCEITNEIFRNYDEFAERMLLCTSMVWTCEMTGRANLTYEEALESEENARKSVKEFPDELKVPVLYVSSKTKRTGFGDMADDVFSYCKDRYFIGEKIEASFTSNKWVESHVLQVIPPNDAEIKKNSPKNGNAEKRWHPPHFLYKYGVEHLDADDSDISEIMIVDYAQIRRKKSTFTRDKCKLFLKQYVEQDEKLHWVVKKSTRDVYGIDALKFDSIFAGPPPDFDPSKRFEKNENGKKSRQETLAKYLTKLDQNNVKTNGTNADIIERMEKKKKEFEEMKKKREEERNELRKRRKEENALITNQLKEWWKPKEDSELENQQALPEFPEIVTKIPQEYLGDVLMIMEFVKVFEKLLKSKNFFNGAGGGVTLQLMEKALLEQEIAGPLIDLIQMLLTAIFREQDEETNEYATTIARPTFLHYIDVEKPMTLENAARFATLAAKWSKDHQGLSLRKLPLDCLTLSEILRLHLLSSGAKLRESGEKGRFTQRGGYNYTDDPGLQFRLSHPHILHELSVKSIVQLPVKDKVLILNCLMNQLLTYEDVRNAIEDRIEKSRQLKLDIRNAQISERKKEAEYNAKVCTLKKEAKKTKQSVQAELERLKIAEDKRRAASEKRIENCQKSMLDCETVLGMDRAFRKYYKLESLPGVVVECYEEHLGVCDPEPVKQYEKISRPDDKTLTEHLQAMLEKQRNGTKKLNGDSSSSFNESVIDIPHPRLLMCTGNEENCNVHGKLRDKTWKFIHPSEQLELLMESLNKRGFRENELLQMLQSDKDTLVKLIERNRLQQDENETKTHGVRTKAKGCMGANFNFPDGTPVETILEQTLIDDILEMEDKIFSGSLGQLHVKDRNQWRNVLSKRNYASFEREIARRTYETRGSDNENVDEEEEEEEKIPNSDGKKKYTDTDPGEFIGKVGKIEVDPDFKTAIECLCVALVQVAYAVEPKFLQKPLGDSTLKKLPTYVPIKNRLENWEKSLFTSTSFSQIFLHYSTLDSCVMWSRSTLLAKCRICLRQKDSENMLLCDSCNRGHHLYCLKPKLQRVPKGDWYCSKCEAVRAPPPPAKRKWNDEVIPQKKRRIFKEEVEEEEEEEVVQEPERVEQNGNTKHSSDDEEEEDDEEYDSEEDAPFDDDQDEDFSGKLCGSCNSGGSMITCEECRASYHKECADPAPKSSRSVLLWVCSDCNGEDEYKSGTSRRHNNNEHKRRRNAKSRHRRRSGRNTNADSNSKKYVEKDEDDDDDEEEEEEEDEEVENGFDNDSEDEDEENGEVTSSSRKRSLRRESGRVDLPLHNAALQDLLSDIMKNANAWPFIKPVQKNEVPDYYEVINQPMDFGTIKYKLNMGEYSMDSQLMCDVALVFKNCRTYNNVDSEVYKCGERLLETFERKCEELGLKIPRKFDGERDEDSRKKKRLN